MGVPISFLTGDILTIMCKLQLISIELLQLLIVICKTETTIWCNRTKSWA